MENNLVVGKNTIIGDDVTFGENEAVNFSVSMEEKSFR